MDELAGRVADLCWAFKYGLRVERVDSLWVKYIISKISLSSLKTC